MAVSRCAASSAADAADNVETVPETWRCRASIEPPLSQCAPTVVTDMLKTIDIAYHWTDEKALACAQVAERRGDLTICLKTKDDPFFIERWIAHHARIVGLRQLVIFDNMSTNQAVLDVYAKYQPELLVIQFSELNNRVHHVPTFRELYGTLADSTTFFVLLDTDEFLVRVEDDRYYADTSIVGFVRSCGDVTWLPGTWLNDAFRSESVFRCGTDMSVLERGLMWGKPIVRASTRVDSVIELIHNVQLPRALVDGRTKTNLFVLHMRHLSPEQRIASITRRLLARSRVDSFSEAVRTFVTERDDLETILAKPTDHLPEGVLKEVADLRRLAALRDSGAAGHEDLKAGHLRFGVDGQVEYFSEVERVLLQRFIRDPGGSVRQALADADAVQQKYWPTRGQ